MRRPNAPTRSMVPSLWPCSRLPSVLLHQNIPIQRRPPVSALRRGIHPDSRYPLSEHPNRFRGTSRPAALLPHLIRAVGTPPISWLCHVAPFLDSYGSLRCRQSFGHVAAGASGQTGVLLPTTLVGAVSKKLGPESRAALNPCRYR